MVRVNCAAIPSALIESELFGRERGAYTGAVSRQAGRFELADRSTIFLDEVGELPLDVQVKLLRVLQDMVIERLGSPHPIKVDVRVIAATNRDLEQAVADRTFREDLYYRLQVFPIRVPALRERVEDIEVLAWSFIREFAAAFGKRIESLSAESLQALQAYPWPGNVRELRNVVERAVIVSQRAAVGHPSTPAAVAADEGPAREARRGGERSPARGPRVDGLAHPRRGRSGRPARDRGEPAREPHARPGHPAPGPAWPGRGPTPCSGTRRRAARPRHLSSHPPTE